MLVEYFAYKYTEDKKNNETYASPYQNNIYIVKETEPIPTPLLVLYFVLYLILGIYAAKLSWYSNTVAGWSYGYKVLFALFAFMFPCTYITAHVLFKLDLLERIKKGRSL